MEAVRIDRFGDVCLTVQSTVDGPQTFRINSAILRLASPVFGKQLNTRLLRIRAKDGGLPHSMQIRESDWSSFKLLFDILHMKPLTQEVELAELVKLAKVVDKYECGHACRLQAERWMKDNLSGYREDLAEYLGLAITFRSHEVFNILSIGLALANYSKKRSDIRDYHATEAIAKVALGKLVPEKTITAINELTQDYVKQVLDVVCDLPKGLAEHFHVDLEGGVQGGHSRTEYCEHDAAVLAAYYAASTATSC